MENHSEVRIDLVVIRCIVLLGTWCIAPINQSEVRSEEKSQQPNILFAIADDWGWPHAGAYGDPV